MFFFVLEAAIILLNQYTNRFLQYKYQFYLISEHYESLGFTQDYFDFNGMFVTLFYALPILLIMIVQMLILFGYINRLMVKGKRLRLMQEQREKEKKKSKKE